MNITVLVKNYDSGHFSIPQATVCTCCLQKALYLLHQQFPTLLVIIYEDKLSISNTTARLLLQARAWHMHIKPAGKRHATPSWTDNAAHASPLWCTPVSFTEIPHGQNDIQRLTSAYGCCRSDSAGQTLEMWAERALPGALCTIPHATSCPSPQADGAGVCTSQQTAEWNPAIGWSFPMQPSSLPETQNKKQRSFQTLHTEPLFSRERDLPPVLLSLNRWTTPKIQQ